MTSTVLRLTMSPAAGPVLAAGGTASPPEASRVRSASPTGGTSVAGDIAGCGTIDAARASIAFAGPARGDGRTLRFRRTA